MGADHFLFCGMGSYPLCKHVFCVTAGFGNGWQKVFGWSGIVAADQVCFNILIKVLDKCHIYD